MSVVPPNANQEPENEGVPPMDSPAYPPADYPAVPPQPQEGAVPPPYSAPEVPYANQAQQPQYQYPPQQQYPGQPQPIPAYATPQPVDPLSNITLNYWLSAFFTLIPALIFYFIDKDKVDQFSYSYQLANLNFSILRTLVSFGAVLLAKIAVIGWFIYLTGVIASLVLFVFAIIAAAKAPAAYRAGQKPPFAFNVPFVK